MTWNKSIATLGLAIAALSVIVVYAIVTLDGGEVAGEFITLAAAAIGALGGVAMPDGGSDE